MKPILVKCPRRLVEEFKQAAKLAFPRETFAFLLGHEERRARYRKVTVTEIHFPEDVNKFCTVNGVALQDRWFTEALDQAAESDSVVVGDIHSHPWTYKQWSSLDGVPGLQRSETDCDRVSWDKIAGICRVYETRTRGLRASIRFWPPAVPLTAILKKK